MSKQTIFKALPAIILSSLLTVAIIYAWREPTQAPPHGNVPAPINVGGTAQFKSGALGIGGVLRGYSTAIFDGHVGIGTTGPTAKLTVAGGHGDTTLRLSASGFGQPTIINDAFLSLWASEPGWTWTGAGIGNNILGSPFFGRINTARGASYMRLLDSAITFDTINSAGTRFADTLYMIHGNVGIGTTRPGAKLNVESSVITGSGSENILKINVVGNNIFSTATGYIGFRVWDASNNAGIDDAARIAVTRVADGSHPSRGGAHLSFWTAPSGITNPTAQERVRITNGGNVGIGTMRPTHRLHVEGTIRATAGTAVYICPYYSANCPGDTCSGLRTESTCVDVYSLYTTCDTIVVHNCTLVGRLVAP